MSQKLPRIDLTPITPPTPSYLADDKPTSTLTSLTRSASADLIPALILDPGSPSLPTFAPPPIDFSLIFACTPKLRHDQLRKLLVIAEQDNSLVSIALSNLAQLQPQLAALINDTDTAPFMVATIIQALNLLAARGSPEISESAVSCLVSLMPRIVNIHLVHGGYPRVSEACISAIGTIASRGQPAARIVAFQLLAGEWENLQLMIEDPALPPPIIVTSIYRLSVIVRNGHIDEKARLAALATLTKLRNRLVELLSNINATPTIIAASICALNIIAKHGTNPDKHLTSVYLSAKHMQLTELITNPLTNPRVKEEAIDALITVAENGPPEAKQLAVIALNEVSDVLRSIARNKTAKERLQEKALQALLLVAQADQ